MRLLFFVTLLFLAACANRTAAPVVPEAAAATDTVQRVFVATNRLEEDGQLFGIDRAIDTTLLSLDIAIPEKRELGSVADGGHKPNPKVHFAIAQQEKFQNIGSFMSEINRDIRAATTPEGREVTVYVHGYNNSFASAAFRMAQLSHDLNIEGPVVSFSWPSKGNLLGYEYDADSILFSRDALVTLLKNLDKTEGTSITLVAHSLGSSLVMEALRQIEHTNPGWSQRALSGVLLISPDINIDVFMNQSQVFTEWPQPFVIFSSQKDRILRFSAVLRGQRHRLGNLDDVKQLSALPVTFVDVSALSDGKDGNHFTVGTSKAFLELVNSSGQLGPAFLKGHSGAAGGLYGGSRRDGNLIELERPMSSR